MRRIFVWLALVAVFALGWFVALVRLPGMIDGWAYPPAPVARKVFVPPPPPAAVHVAPPELPAEAVAPLKVATIPGLVELPSGKSK